MWCAILSILSTFASGSASGDEMIFNARMHEHVIRMEKMHKEMSLETAVTFLKHNGNASLEILDKVLGEHKRPKHYRHSRDSFLAVVDDPSASSATTYNSGEVANALKMINGMIYEAQFKYETELARCCHFDKSQSALMEETHITISAANAKAAESKKDMLDAQSGITVAETQIPKLKADLEAWNQQCADQLATIDLMLKTMSGDIDLVSNITETTKCSSPSATSAVNLLQCRDDCGAYATVDGSVRMSSRMRAFALQLLSESEPNGTAAVLETTSPMPRTIPRARPCKVPRTLDPMSDKCTLTKSSCTKLVERFMNIQTELLETQRELEEKRSDLDENCKLTQDNYRAQIETYEIKLKDYNTKLAAATATNANALEESRLKNNQLKEFIHNYEEMTTECHANYESLEGEICGLTKIRGEVSNHLKGNGNMPFFQDCEVSEWVSVEPGCSVTCGGGIEKMTRTIESYPDGGAPCPDLQRVDSCNEEKCPIDCRVGDWSGWSDCSAKCGGGVQDRIRPIITEPMYKGVACGETQQVQSCNAQSCDKDCILSDWTAWSNCSKSCGTGHSERIRTVLEPQIGEGSCPDVSGGERLNKEACNAMPCLGQPGQLLECKAKRDVVVLIDGSGSVGEAGWKMEVAAAEMLVKAINPSPVSSAMSIFVYSGPKWLCDYYLCVGAQDTSSWFQKYCDATADYDCGTEVLSHFSSDAASLEEKLKNAPFPARTTFTSKALAKVEAELTLGQADAKAVVVVMTDGHPADKKATAKAAKKLGEKAKVIWVPITQYAPLAEIREWAADPEDVIPVANFEDLNEIVVNQIISTACDNLGVISLGE